MKFLFLELCKVKHDSHCCLIRQKAFFHPTAVLPTLQVICGGSIINIYFFVYFLKNQVSTVPVIGVAFVTLYTIRFPFM